MDWFPLYNSLRIALVSSIFVFLRGSLQLIILQSFRLQ